MGALYAELDEIAAEDKRANRHGKKVPQTHTYDRVDLGRLRPGGPDPSVAVYPCMISSRWRRRHPNLKIVRRKKNPPGYRDGYLSTEPDEDADNEQEEEEEEDGPAQAGPSLPSRYSRASTAAPEEE